MKGKDAIETGVSAMLADRAFKLDFSTDRVEIAATGDMAVSRGSYTSTGTDPATKQTMHDKGSCVPSYQTQTEGSWKAVLDINTSEVPRPSSNRTYGVRIPLQNQPLQIPKQKPLS